MVLLDGEEAEVDSLEGLYADGHALGGQLHSVRRDRDRHKAPLLHRRHICQQRRHLGKPIPGSSNAGSMFLPVWSSAWASAQQRLQLCRC